jgi:hypothetical protein
MTVLGEFLSKKSIKNADVSRKTGISTSRLSELSRNESTKLKAEELFLIALAIDVAPIEILSKVCGHVKLKKVKIMEPNLFGSRKAYDKAIKELENELYKVA